MSGLPDGVEPYYPVHGYDRRIGVLRGLGSTKPVGHVMVESVYWRRLGGVLGWKRWCEPEQAALGANGNSR